jgi:hypothetical protein
MSEQEGKKKGNFPYIHQFTATTTPSIILPANLKRKAVLIYNNGAATVELVSSGGVSGSGIPIPVGMSYESDHFNCQGEYYVVAEAGTVDLRIEEDISGNE